MQGTKCTNYSPVGLVERCEFVQPVCSWAGHRFPILLRLTPPVTKPRVRELT